MTSPEPPAALGAGRRRVADSSERNKGPILEVLKRVLPETGLVLEIGSGTGQHAAHFAPCLPGLVWQPSEPDPDMRVSIEAWVAETAAPNLNPPVDLDVTGAVWPITEAQAVFSANMIHIAPWECCLGLLAGAGRILSPARGGEDPQTSRGSDRETKNGLLILYGPFKRDGRHTAPSNEQFDASLKARDPSWGVRDLNDVCEAADKHGLALAETVAMPANNLTVVFRKGG